MKLVVTSATVGGLEGGPLELYTTERVWERGSYWKAMGYKGEFRTPGEALNNVLRRRRVISGAAFGDAGWTGEPGR